MEKHDEAPRTEILEQVKQLKQYCDNIIPKVLSYQSTLATPNNIQYIDYQSPQDLKSIYDFSLQEKGEPLEQVIQHIDFTMKYSCRTSHPRFFDQLYAGSNPVGQIAEFITAVLNTNVHTYAVSPVFAIMEKECIEAMGELIGYKKETCDGIFVPGGTYSNLIAFMLARHEKFPHVKVNGFKESDKPVCFTSKQAHYSIKRAAMISGIGMNACQTIPANMKGEMIPEELEQAIQAAIQEGKTPFFVCAVAGTTIMGGFDQFEEISKICKKYSIWLHIDGCWGGSVLMSKKHRYYK